MYLSVWWNVNFLYNSRLHNKIICMAKYLCSLWVLSCCFPLFLQLNPPNHISSVQVLFSQDVLTDFTSWCVSCRSAFSTNAQLSPWPVPLLKSWRLQGMARLAQIYEGDLETIILGFSLSLQAPFLAWWIEINQSLMFKWFVVLPWWSSG